MNNARYQHSHKKLKLVSGLSVPSLNINFILCCFRRAHTTSVTTSHVSLRMLCIAFLVVTAITSMYIGETGRRPREHFSEDLRSIPNRSRGFPVPEHFNSASHSLDDIVVCGMQQCSGSNINCKQHKMKLIFKLGTLIRRIEH